MITASFATTAIDLILVILLIELVVLCLMIRTARRQGMVSSMLANAASGLFLILALRGVLTGADLLWIGPCLLGSGLAHWADMRIRWSNRV